MATTLVLSLLAALGVSLVVMLVIVSISRKLHRRELAEAPAPSPRKRLMRIGRDTTETTATDRRKRARAVGGAVASLAIIMGIVSMAKHFNDGDIEPEVSDIAAGQLHGTMINARNSDPVILIVPGSGPTDRDGNNPMGLKSDAYKLLAEALIEERIATVRVDKRGMFGSKDAGDPNITSTQPYIDDIHAWIDAIKAERGSKCVWLLGHSEGALMVTLAAEERKDVCGLILVAGMGRKMSDVIREQLHANPANAPVLDQALGAIAELEAGRHVDVTDMHPALLPLFNPRVQEYLISMFAIDPVEALRRADKKTEIIQGDHDIQVSLEDAHLLDKAPKTRLRIIKGMNHILKDAPADRDANIATYADPSLPVSTELVKRIRQFVKGDT